ncbi:hypothetical protein EDM00_11075 [Ornithobacterium rhinotracheale]|uniref:hypothetical protein n=1 Tax=Ornithobacterium rhinotracheale TaxID=28251 RepID=UPI00129D0CC2|nr:hypothetical protein [Ornithobacterium rhinotracheale]MRI64522.1 hypothetical protein [Ornithobacterium rhinotracheale]
MELFLNEKRYRVIDTKEKVTIADSFVVRQNKIGSGNGEAKLYVGNDNVETRDFFGSYGFGIHCFMMKSDLEKYLEDTKEEYLNPEQPYLKKDELPILFQERKRLIKNLPFKIDFEVSEQTQIIGPRIYVNSNDKAYKLIRELSYTAPNDWTKVKHILVDISF